ncbi:MAG: hypothetical protein AABW51_04000 [Nanoarchaeota archaeon]
MRKKIFKTKRGTRVVFKIPFDEAEGITDEKVNKYLERFYGTSDLKTEGLYNPKLSDFRLTELIRQYPRLYQSSRDDSYSFTLMENEPVRLNKKPYYLGAGAKDRWRCLNISNDGKNIIIKPLIALHGVTADAPWVYHQPSRDGRDTYDDLMDILKKGFQGFFSSDGDNATIKSNKRRRISATGGENPSSWAQSSNKSGVTKGDKYTLEFIPALGTANSQYNKTYSQRVKVSFGKPQDILSVNIELSEHLPSSVIEEKMKFYTETITGKYGIPVRFYYREFKTKGIEGIDLKRVYLKKGGKDLGQKLLSSFAGVSLILAVYLFSLSLTGNAIGNLSSKNSIAGIILFVAGLFGFFLFLKNKKSIPQ